jgi:probable HAF family extracellular repeat protein
MTLSYNFTPLAYPIPGVGPAYYTNAVAINDSGQVVGSYGGEFEFHAFLYSGEIYTVIDPEPGLTNAAALDISNDGKALVYTDVYYDYYVYDNGTYILLTNTPLGYQPGDVTTVGAAISDAGVVGYSYDPVWYADGQAKYQGFTYENGVYAAINVPGAQYTVAGDINDSGQVVGYDYFNGINQGFLYANGVFTPIVDPNADLNGTIAQWINNDGQVAGYYYVNTQQQYFIYDNGVFTDIAVPGAIETGVQGISDAGVFGFYNDGNYSEHGFIYRRRGQRHAVRARRRRPARRRRRR